jgi:hypothetical protein
MQCWRPGKIQLISHQSSAILICVEAPEYVFQPLWDDAALHEVIKRHLPSTLSVRLSDEDVVELVREQVAQTWECLLELVLADHPGVVPVIGAEDILPGCDALPTPRNSLKFSPALCSWSNTAMTDLTVTGLNGVCVLLESACWGTLSDIPQLLSLSTHWKTFLRKLWSRCTGPSLRPGGRSRWPWAEAPETMPLHSRAPLLPLQKWFWCTNLYIWCNFLKK